MQQTEIVKTREHLLKILTDNEKEFSNISIIDENALYVEWKYIEPAVVSSPHTSVVLGSYVTALGRLKLYEILERLNKRCLYFDTDSCIFISREGQYEPELGPYLGDLTNELEGYRPKIKKNQNK